MSSWGREIEALALSLSDRLGGIGTVRPGHRTQVGMLIEHGADGLLAMAMAIGYGHTLLPICLYLSSRAEPSRGKPSIPNRPSRDPSSHHYRVR